MTPELHDHFQKALDFALQHHAVDLQWIIDLKPVETPQAFMREYTYVVCASGFRAKYAARLTELIEERTCQWLFVTLPDLRSHFRNERKTSAIYDTWSQIKELGWGAFRTRYCQPISLAQAVNNWEMEKLPYIGKTTRWHLARNLGLMKDAVKPDVHLNRLAVKFNGSATPWLLCKAIQESFPNFSLGTIDFILWCYAAHREGSTFECCDGGARLR